MGGLLPARLAGDLRPPSGADRRRQFPGESRRGRPGRLHREPLPGGRLDRDGRGRSASPRPDRSARRARRRTRGSPGPRAAGRSDDRRSVSDPVLLIAAALDGSARGPATAPRRRHRAGLESARSAVRSTIGPEPGERGPVQRWRGGGALNPEAAQLLGPIVVGRAGQLGPHRRREGKRQCGDPPGRADPARRSGTGNGPIGRPPPPRRAVGRGRRRPRSNSGGDGLESRRRRSGRPGPSSRSSGRRPRLGSGSDRLQNGRSISPAGQFARRASLVRIEPDAVGEVAAGPSPLAALRLVLAGSRGQPGDFGTVADPAIPEGPRRQRPAIRPGQERPHRQVAHVPRRRIAGAEPLDLEAVARTEAVAHRALRVVDLLHPDPDPDRLDAREALRVIIADGGPLPACFPTRRDPGSLGELIEPRASPDPGRFGLRLGGGGLGSLDELGDQLVDRVTSQFIWPIGDDGLVLLRVEPDDATGAVVAEPGDDDAVAGLEPGAGFLEAGVLLGLRTAGRRASGRGRPGCVRPRPAAAWASWRACSASERIRWTTSHSGEACPSSRRRLEVAGGAVDEVGGHGQAPGDLQGVGGADVADVDAVERPEASRRRTRRRRSRLGGW